MTQTRILVVDDHAVVREGVRATLAADPALIVVGEAVDGDDACVQGAALQPDVVIMDLVMPGLNGSDATRRLLTVSPGSKVIALTLREEPVYVREALRAGVPGYVLKRTMLPHRGQGSDLDLSEAEFPARGVCLWDDGSMRGFTHERTARRRSLTARHDWMAFTY